MSLTENLEIPPEQPKIVSEFTPGGHELDEQRGLPMIGWLAVLALVILGAAVGVSQLFQYQARELTRSQLAAESELLRTTRAREHEALTTYGKPAVADAEPGKVRIPVARAMELIAGDPARLKHGPEPPDFVHPDDEPKAAPSGGAPTQ